MTFRAFSKKVGLIIQVYLSGDVVDEQNQARNLFCMQLSNDPLLKGKTAFNAETWDDPTASISIPPPSGPQRAVNHWLPRAPECDIIAVILWSRMRTPLPPDKYRKSNEEPHLSGTGYEFEDAVRPAARYEVLVYLRMKRAKKFFRHHFDNPYSTLCRSYNLYAIRKPEQLLPPAGNPIKTWVRNGPPMPPYDANVEVKP